MARFFRQTGGGPAIGDTYRAKQWTDDRDVALRVPGAERLGAVMAFSLRSGGCSDGPFSALNFSVQHGDSRENVQRNFEILGERLAIDPARIATCRQVHGDGVALLDGPPIAPLTADAIITTVPDLYPAVKTADCVPILLVDPVRGISAAVHAGWRGTVKRIARKVITIMERELGSRTEDIIAGLGPAIRACCYEVDNTVLVPFRDQIPDADRFIHKGPGPRPGTSSQSLDLVAANRYELTSSGISARNIHEVKACTCCSPEILFSHRRDGTPSGRHISLAGFRSALR